MTRELQHNHGLLPFGTNLREKAYSQASGRIGRQAYVFPHILRQSARWHSHTRIPIDQITRAKFRFVTSARQPCESAPSGNNRRSTSDYRFPHRNTTSPAFHRTNTTTRAAAQNATRRPTLSNFNITKSPKPGVPSTGLGERRADRTPTVAPLAVSFLEVA